MALSEVPDPQYLTFSSALSREITEIQSQNTRPILVCRFPHLITIRNTTGEELSGLIIISLCFIILETANSSQFYLYNEKNIREVWREGEGGGNTSRFPGYRTR